MLAVSAAIFLFFAAKKNNWWGCFSQTSTLSADIILPLGPGIYSFRLAPGEITKEKFAIQPDCEYSFSSSTMADPARQVFFVIYDEKTIKIDRADIPIPPGPGPFKIMAGESGAYVKLLIIKK